MKKVIKIVLIAILVVFIIVAVRIHNMAYPDMLAVGDGEKKIACVGDSITFSQGVLKTREVDGWPSVLAGLLGEEYQTLNYGLPNRTLQSTGNMPYFEEKLAVESLKTDAGTVIFMLGSNDTKPVNWNAERFETEYREAVLRYKNLESQPKVYVMLPPRIFLEETGEKDCSNTILTEEVQAIIRKIAEEEQVGLIDLYTLTEDHADWFADGLHPNKEGNRAIAEHIYQVLTEENEL